MAAKEPFLDFRNVYRMKMPDINNNNNIYWLILYNTRKYCTRSKNIALVSDSYNIFLARAIFSCIILNDSQHMIILESKKY